MKSFLLTEEGMRSAGCKHAEELIKAVCGLLEFADRFENERIQFEAWEVRAAGYGNVAVAVKQGALGALVALGYLNVRSRRVTTDVYYYVASRQQLERLKKELESQ